MIYEDERYPGIIFNTDNKFDIQLKQALIAEKQLAEIFCHRKIEKIELKSEAHQWEDTQNICIEYRRGGKPSGIAVTEADYWAHDLKRVVDGERRTLLYLLIPLDRLKMLAREAYLRGQYSESGGDGGLSATIKLSLWDLLR